jgi:ABC-type antimicrobial peptide transport system permease subunit
MTFHDDIVSAFRHSWRHKLRTGLALLGIAASVASIVVLVSVADAKRRDTAAYFEGAGARIAQVIVLDQRGLELVGDLSYDFNARAAYFRYNELDYRPVKDWRDAERLREACPDTVAHISPISMCLPFPDMVCGPYKDDMYTYGVTHEFFDCIGPKCMAGRPLSQKDVDERAKVAVIAWEVQHDYIAEVFGGKEKLVEAYGQGYSSADLPLPFLDDEMVVRINGKPFDIVGVLPPVCPVLEPFFRYNLGVLVPFGSEREFSETYATNRFLFYPKGTAAEAFAELKPRIEEMYPGSTAIMNSAEAWADQERAELGAATTGFVLIGLGTLFVSAMAVMNTMLVSVRERRPEIGIRKALGASQRDIRNQFIRETLLVSGVGVLLGVLLAFFTGFLVQGFQNIYIIPVLERWAKETQFGHGGWSMEPRGWDLHFGVVTLVAAVSAVVAMGISLLASLLPAREAAGMHPVACLANAGAQRQGRARNWAVLRHPWLRPFFEDPERTWLTVSSLAIGTAVLIVLTSVGEYNRLRSADWYDRLGEDCVSLDLSLVLPNWEEDLPKLDEDFAKRVEKECPHVTGVWMECWFPKELWHTDASAVRTAALTVDNENRQRWRVWGVDAVPAGYGEFYPHRPLVAGREISQDDVDSKAAVCVLDEHAASVLFPEGEALGGTVECGGFSFTVQGILSNEDPYDDQPWGGVRIPMSWARDVLQTEESFWLLAHTTNARLACDEIVQLYEDNFATTLREPLRHFKMIGQEQARSRREAWLNAFLTMAIGLGTLIVGGVGVMNTMLISTAARTREVGTLRALGATRWRVVRQFLFESFVLSLGGGAVGVLAGVILAKFGLPLIYLAWEHEDALWRTVLSLHWPAAAMAFAVFIGLIAAAGPAIKASFIRPAEALRYE